MREARGIGGVEEGKGGQEGKRARMHRRHGEGYIRDEERTAVVVAW